LYPNNLRAFGINRKINRRNNPSHNDQMINLLYNSNRSLSFSVKNNKAKQTHIPNIKNQNKSYFALNMKALIQTCCNHIAKSDKTMVVIIKIKINWIINLDSTFFSNNFQVILSVLSLFFTALIRCFRFVKIYRNRITTKRSSINSFHIRSSVQNLPFRPSLKVTKVCKKNCNKSQITNILHSKINRNLRCFEQILDHRDVSFFIIM
jgi:hypothetical protein